MGEKDFQESGPRFWAPRLIAQHCTGMTNWPNTIQCLGSDDIMSLGIESLALNSFCGNIFLAISIVKGTKNTHTKHAMVAT